LSNKKPQARMAKISKLGKKKRVLNLLIFKAGFMVNK
jgi:hypothetical protein